MSIKDQDFPFDIKIGFKKLFESYERLLTEGSAVSKECAAQVLKIAKEYPKLTTGLDSAQEVEAHQEQIDFILNDFFTEVLASNEIKIASIPFKNYIFKSSQRFKDILNAASSDYDLDFKAVNENDFT